MALLWACQFPATHAGHPSPRTCWRPNLNLGVTVFGAPWRLYREDQVRVHLSLGAALEKEGTRTQTLQKGGHGGETQGSGPWEKPALPTLDHRLQPQDPGRRKVRCVSAHCVDWVRSEWLRPPGPTAGGVTRWEEGFPEDWGNPRTPSEYCSRMACGFPLGAGQTVHIGSASIAYGLS